MTRLIACAVVRDDPPQVFVAEDLETLNWVLALQVVAAHADRRAGCAVRRLAIFSCHSQKHFLDYRNSRLASEVAPISGPSMGAAW